MSRLRTSNDADDPLDLLSTHPLTVKGTDNTEKVVKKNKNQK